MAQEYIIKSVKKASAWSGSYGDFQDYALDIGAGEPVKLVMAQPVIDEPKEGDKLYGKLMEEKAKDGRIYYKLKLESRPEGNSRERNINAQWAIGQAVQVYLSGEPSAAAYDNIEKEARNFYLMINKVIGE